MVLTDIPFEPIEEEEMAAIEAVFLQLPTVGSRPDGVISTQRPLSASATYSSAYQPLPIVCGSTPERKPKLLKCSQSVSVEGTSWNLPHYGKGRASVFCISTSALLGSGSEGGRPIVDGELGDIEDSGDAAKEVQEKEGLEIALRKRLEKGLAVTDFTALVCSDVLPVTLFLRFYALFYNRVT